MERKRASDFPQDLLDLLDAYVHGRIDRRAFLRRVERFVRGGVSAAALFEMLRSDYGLAIQVSRNDARIRATIETLSSPQGNGAVKGYLVRPAKADKLAGVLVIHENRGLIPTSKTWRGASPSPTSSPFPA